MDLTDEVHGYRQATPLSLTIRYENLLLAYTIWKDRASLAAAIRPIYTPTLDTGRDRCLREDF